VTRKEGVPGLSAPVGIGQHDTIADEDSLEGEILALHDLVDVVEHLIGEQGDVHAAV